MQFSHHYDYTLLTNPASRAPNTKTLLLPPRTRAPVPTRKPRTMALHHIVLFKFKPTASAQEVQAVSCVVGGENLEPKRRSLNLGGQACDRMLALATNCLHPETKKPYVKAAAGGKNNSPEGKSVGTYLPRHPRG